MDENLINTLFCMSISVKSAVLRFSFKNVYNKASRQLNYPYIFCEIIKLQDGKIIKRSKVIYKDY